MSGDAPSGGESLTYVCYNPVLESDSMIALGRPDLARAVPGLRRMAESRNLPTLFVLGRAAAEHDVLGSHLPAAFDI